MLKALRALTAAVAGRAMHPGPEAATQVGCNR